MMHIKKSVSSSTKWSKSKTIKSSYAKSQLRAGTYAVIMTFIAKLAPSADSARARIGTTDLLLLPIKDVKHYLRENVMKEKMIVAMI